MTAQTLRDAALVAVTIPEPQATPDLGDVGRCRTCLLPIEYMEVVTPGRLPRTGWSDRARQDELVCFKSRNYDHVPLSGRERAYWNAGALALARAHLGGDA